MVAVEVIDGVKISVEILVDVGVFVCEAVGVAVWKNPPVLES